MNGKTLRTLSRALHLVGSALIGTYVYSPFSDLAWFTALMQFGVIPLLALSGVMMWQQGRVQRWLQRGGARRPIAMDERKH
jgi:hypothetical protein